jgi:hypothetical protein
LYLLSRGWKKYKRYPSPWEIDFKNRSDVDWCEDQELGIDQDRSVIDRANLGASYPGFGRMCFYVD